MQHPSRHRLPQYDGYWVRHPRVGRPRCRSNRSAHNLSPRQGWHRAWDHRRDRSSFAQAWPDLVLTLALYQMLSCLYLYFTAGLFFLYALLMAILSPEKVNKSTMRASCLPPSRSVPRNSEVLMARLSSKIKISGSNQAASGMLVQAASKAACTCSRPS